MNYCCNAKDILKSVKLRITSQRIELLQIILTKTASFYAGQIFEEIRQIISIDLATVYRILHIFAEKKIIRKVIEIDGIQFYESACEHQPDHNHFICECCKQIICLKDLKQIDSEIINQVSLPYKINRINFFLRGICDHCQESGLKND